MKKSTWIWIIAAVLALAALVVGMLAIYNANKPKPPVNTDTTTQSSQDGTTQSGENTTAVPGKSFTVEVVHGDGSTKTLVYESAKTYLGEAVYEEGLVIADESNPGMFHTVDGEKADWNENQSYWAFYIGEDYAMYGIEQTPIEDGAVYRLVYTIG